MEAQGALAEGGQDGVGAFAFAGGHFARVLEAIDGGEGDLVLGGVLAGGFAEGLGGLFDIEDIVDDLEGEAHVFAVAGEGFVFRFGGSGKDGAESQEARRRAPVLAR